MQLTPEISAILVPALLGLLVTIITLAGAYARIWIARFEMRARDWENMAKETRDVAGASMAISETNHELLRRNTEMTENIERNSNGINDKLTKITVGTAFAAGRLRDKLEARGSLSTDDINEFESEFKEVVQANGHKEGS